MLKRLWREDEGILTFEWILLLTLLVIGVVGGVAGIRDAIIHEAQGVVGAMLSLDQSYVVAPPLAVSVAPVGTTTCVSNVSSAGWSNYQDQGSYFVGVASGVPLQAQPVLSATPVCAVVANPL